MKLTSASLNSFVYSLDKAPVIVCIGSPNVTGDSFGPITGQLLCDCFQIPTFVYGTMVSPVTAINLGRTLRHIRLRHYDRKIIAVDCAVGNQGKNALRFFHGAVSPGKAMGKALPQVGDFSITATTADSVASLFTCKLSDVFILAKAVAGAISYSVQLKAGAKPKHSPSSQL